MFPFQAVSRQAVIKLLLRRLPVHKVEVFAVVLEMAAHAILAVWVLHLNFGVIPMLCRQPLCNFFVTIQAFKDWSVAAKLVATCALRGSGQGLVSFREWSRRNLGVRSAGYPQQPE